MFRIIFIDMGNGFFHGIHHFYGKNIIQIFCSPVLFRCGNSSRHQGTGCFICADFHMFLIQTFCQYRQESIFHFSVYKKGLTCIADSHTLCFCIDNNICCHGKICCLVHINMAVTSSCLNYRNCALVYNGFDQPSPTSWNQHIHILIHFHKFRSCLSGSIFDQLNRVFCNATVFYCLTDTFYNCSIGMNGIASTFQNYNISGFKTKSKRIRSYIRPGFIDNSNYP